MDEVHQLTYTLPFIQGQLVAELGGGDQPLFHPNVDVREMPTVDIVADLNEPLPLDNNTYDGIYCRFMLEHISWRSVPTFFADVYRVLAQGGRVVFITANLLEQAKMIAKAPELDDQLVGMVFGDNNYPENTHRAGFSPSSITKMLRAAGFDSIIVLPLPEWKGDMIVEARKPVLSGKELFDKHYFNGGAKVGGYAFEGYRDFYKNWITVAKILDQKPESALELGAGRGYLVKRLRDAGVDAQGLEISHHCHLTRVTDHVTEFDICKIPWPLPTQSIDLCYSIAVLEHIPEADLPNVFNEMTRVCKRGFHGIDYGESDNGFDKTHVTLRSAEWWANRLPPKHLGMDKDKMEQSSADEIDYEFVPAGDLKLKLNLGSYITMFHHGWVNIDMVNLESFAWNNGYKHIQHDLRQGIPFPDNSVDLMFSSHFLEHLTYAEAQALLKDCHRALKKGGTFRLCVPNTKLLIDKYLESSLKDYDEIVDDKSGASTELSRLWALLMNNHASAFDWPTLQQLAIVAGFKQVEAKARNSGHRIIMKETYPTVPDISLFAEFRK